MSAFPVGRSQPPRRSLLSRRARDLMSIASLLAFMAGAAWLLIGIGLLAHLDAGVMGSSSSDRLLGFFGWLPASDASASRLGMVWLIGGSAAVAPPIALRRLGYRLWKTEGLDLELARRFRTLGHALSFNFVAGLTISVIGDGQWAAGTAHRYSFGTGSWSLIAAVLLAYLVAELMRDGAMAVAENRDFV